MNGVVRAALHDLELELPAKRRIDKTGWDRAPHLKP